MLIRRHLPFWLCAAHLGHVFCRISTSRATLSDVLLRSRIWWLNGVAEIVRATSWMTTELPRHDRFDRGSGAAISVVFLSWPSQLEEPCSFVRLYFGLVQSQTEYKTEHFLLTALKRLLAFILHKEGIVAVWPSHTFVLFCSRCMTNTRLYGMADVYSSCKLETVY